MSLPSTNYQTTGAPACDSRPATQPDMTVTHLGSGSMRVAMTTLRYQTERGPQFIDITDDVTRAAAASGILHGLVVVYTQHTTAALTINEHEPLLIADLEHFVSELSPADRDYQHNNFLVRVVNMEEDESPNGHAHCQSLLLNASAQLPLAAGDLQLGRWQRVFLVELDRARPRTVIVQTLGC